jgi:hypothetical protein
VSSLTRGDLVEIFSAPGLIWKVERLKTITIPFGRTADVANLILVGRVKGSKVPKRICKIYKRGEDIHERGVDIFLLKKVPPLLAFTVETAE